MSSIGQLDLLVRLRKLHGRMPTMHAVHAADDRHLWPDDGPPDDNHSSTVSPEKGAHGWTNDSGCSGYGLPEQIANDMAELTQLLPNIIAQLEKQ